MDSGAKIEDERPMVSVVIPVYNDPDGVSATLKSVLNQNYPDDQYEIIVADNGSTDNTRETVRSYSEKYPGHVSLVVEDQIQSPAAARNKGIERASGSVFAFIDADMTVEETWLEAVVTSLLGNDREHLSCAVETYAPEGSETLAARYDHLFAFPIREYVEKSDFSGAGGLVVRKEVLDAVGPFDIQLRFNADKEFTRRIHETGFKLYFDPSITAYHPARASVAEQLRKSFRIGRGIVHLHKAYPKRFDAGSPFRLRSYLPLSPRWFRSRIEDEPIDSEYEAVGLYLIASLKKLARSAGSLYEHMEGASTPRKQGTGKSDGQVR